MLAAKPPKGCEDARREAAVKLKMLAAKPPKGCKMLAAKPPNRLMVLAAKPLKAEDARGEAAV